VLQVGQVEVGLPWELDDQFGARSAEQGDQHNSPEGVQQQNQERLNVSNARSSLADSTQAPSG